MTIHENIHVLTPFSRPQNLDLLCRHLAPLGVIWHPIHHDNMAFPSEPWIRPLKVKLPAAWDPCYAKLNALIEHCPIIDDDWYGVLCDDDLFAADVIPALRSGPEADNGAIVSAKRGHYIVPTGLPHPTSTLLAAPRNMRVNHVSNGQMFLRGRLLKTVRYQIVANADGRLCEMVHNMPPIRYLPKAFTFLNILQPGRWDRAAVARLVANGQLNVDPSARLPKVAALTLVRDTPDLVEAMRVQIADVRIVDNGSIEPVVDAWLRLPENRYWSGGWNAAMQQLAAEGIEWAWLLNSDVRKRLNPGQLDALVHYAQQHQAVMVSPGIRNCSWPMMRVRGIHDVHYIDCVCPVVNVAWFMAARRLRRDAARLGRSDLELCYRTQADKKIVVGSMVVDHPYRTTSNRLNDETMYQIGDTRRYLESKHGPAIRNFLPGYWNYRMEE